jgi:hypothetical protein
MGELHLFAENDWRVIAPTDTGPQPYNPGGEMAMWQSRDQGQTWIKLRAMTSGSAKNHTYARRALHCQDDFVALWADGDARRPSSSRLYFANRSGDVFRLPEAMTAETARPEKVP